MNSVYYIKDPDKTECVLQVTMSLEKWKKLRDEYLNKDTESPAYELHRIIGELVTKAEETFYGQGEY